MENSFIELLGIKCPASQANNLKKFLIYKNFLNNGAKTITTNDFVIFPLKLGIKRSELVLNDLNLEISSFSFPHRPIRKSVEQLLLVELPNRIHNLIPKSYDIVGEILLVKIEEEILEYKEKIASIYLSALPIKSVFNKVANVQTKHRVATWECIGGIDNSFTVHTMNQLRFFVDISKVYFNPRLNNEYLIITEQIAESEIIWDLFCGIGAFTLTLASKKHVTIHANDINPDAIEMLEKNISENKKLLIGEIFTYNTDTSTLLTSLPIPDKIFMNLPEKSTDFLPKIFFQLAGKLDRDAVIYLYYFGRKQSTDRQDLNLNKDIQRLLASINQLALDHGLRLVNIVNRIVRVVAPSKTHFVSELTMRRF